MMSEQIYLNTASCGLLSEESVEAANILYKGMLTNASNAVEPLRDHGLERIRDKIATFIETPSSQVALIPNFSWGLNAIIQSLRGDEKILLYNNDYPSLTAPFKINGFDISWIRDKDGFKIDIDELKEELLKNRINILAISHVQWLTGFKIDIEDLGRFCKEHDIIFILDATQSLGAVSIQPSKQNIDVLISSNYKWMNAGFGTGIIYVAESFMNKYPPVVGGSNSYVLQNDVSTYDSSVKNFEPGHINMHGLIVLEKSIEYKLYKTITNIEAHNKHLIQIILDNIHTSLILGPADLKFRSSIVMIKDSGNLFEYITRNGIVAIKRGDNIRISVHHYNTEREVYQFVNLVNAAITSAA